MRVLITAIAVIALLLLASEPTFAQGPVSIFNPIKAQTAYVFIDGSNLFFKLREAGIQLLNLYQVVKDAVQPRELVRAYLYTIEDRFRKAQTEHGPDFCKNII